MATITLTVPDDATVIATLKKVFPNSIPNARGNFVPTDAQLAANVKAYLVKCLQQRCRGYLYDIAEADARKTVQDVSVT